MSDEDVIRKRLIFDGDGTGEDRRLNVMLKMVTKWINTTDETEEECQSTYDKILAQLALVENSWHQSEFVHRQTSEQLDKYKKLQTNTEKSITVKNKEITKRKNELEKVKIIKQNRIQYDLLAKAIAQEPPRKDMNKHLKTLKKDLADLAVEKKQLDQKLHARKKQFNVLFTSANSLAALVNDHNNKSKDQPSTSESESMSE